MKKILLMSVCLFFVAERSQCAVQEIVSNSTFLKQDPKGNSQPIQNSKKKSKKTKKAEQNEMIDKKISISDENQPVNKGKTKKK